jgi:hypothetical protein
MLCPFQTSKLVNSYIFVCRNVNPPTLALKTCILRRRLLTSNYKRNKFYSPQLALFHSGFYDSPQAKALLQSNALVPQSQFRTIKPFFTGSAYIISTCFLQTDKLFCEIFVKNYCISCSLQSQVVCV